VIAAALAPRWRAALDGDAAVRARSMIESIIEQAAPYPSHELGLDGDAGWALGFAYLGRDELAETCIDRAIERVAREASPLRLYDGLVGVAWVVAHLGGDGDAAIDDAVRDAVSRATPESPFELLYGLAGLGAYLVERRASGIELLVARLADAVLRPRPASELGDGLRARFRGGFHDLGIAHGITGVIAVLAQAQAAGLAPPSAAQLVTRAVVWLRAWRDERGRDQFPGLVSPEGDAFPPRFGWCSGDLGVALALFRAGQAFARPAWCGDAIAIALRATDRTPAESDSTLCHGSACVALLFHRFHHATGEPRFLAAAARWYEHAMTFGELDGVGLLGGSLGLALALHAATTSDEPAWDRVLGIS
jgi:class I lanthipeptide synthase